MSKIQLTKSEVNVKDELSWGDSEKIQSVIMSGAKMKGNAQADMNFDFDPSLMLEAKYAALECAVVSIKEGDKEFKFTREWMNELSQADGEKLYKAVDALSSK